MEPFLSQNVNPAQQDSLLILLDPLNAVNARQEDTKSTGPLVVIVQRALLLLLGPQVKLHVMHAQQEPLLSLLDPLNAANAEQENTKSTGPLVVIVQRALLLLLDLQAKLHVMHAQQEPLLNRLHPLNAANVEQENTKSIELLVITVQRALLPLLDHQVKLHVMHAQ